jgi:DNA-binding XRE family transcriptional regulator
MSDDLEQFHARQMANDPQYAVARQLLELGEAVAQLRQSAKMTRGQLGKLLRVKAQDIAIVEEETPRAPAGLLEAALRVLVQANKPQAARTSEISDSIRTVRHLRPALVPA